MKKEDLFREAADKVWELSKSYSFDKEIMNILKDCAAELHLESRNISNSDSKITSLYLIKKDFNF